MGKTQYRNVRWFDFASKIRKRDGEKCTKCGRSNGVVLQVHHIRYREKCKPWEYPQADCITLCKGCHANEHGVFDYPRHGWILLDIIDNEYTDAICERPKCGTAIRYEHNIYHPIGGHMTVGSQCVEWLTEEDREISAFVLRLNKRIWDFIEKSEWEEKLLDCGVPLLHTYYKNHELCIYGKPPYYKIRAIRKISGERRWEKSKVIRATNKTTEQCKEMLYIIIRGWISKDEVEKKAARALYNIVKSA